MLKVDECRPQVLWVRFAGPNLPLFNLTTLTILPRLFCDVPGAERKSHAQLHA